jgi:hypothetical protein
MALAHIDRARHTSSNGGSSDKAMQGIEHLPDSLPAGMHWRESLKALWYRFTSEWEPVTVNKSIDSVTMPKWIAIGIFTAVLAFGAQSWWRSTDQRDMLIELKTELRMAKEYEAERSRQLKEQAELNKVHIDSINGELKTIKGMLTASQINTLEQIKRGNN